MNGSNSYSGPSSAKDSASGKPTIVSAESIDLFYGSRTIVVRVEYGGEILTASFTGRSRGGPGHVTAIIEGTEVPVAFPQRYGKTFDVHWVENYFEKEARDG